MSGGCLLCLETATPTARVAVIDQRGVTLAAGEATAARHSARVLGLCDETLRASGVRPAALAAIACGAGPGSFTGLRVGLSVAKGLALGTGVPLLLVPSLEALALDIFDALGDLDAVAAEVAAVPCLDAGKGEVYAAAYRADAEALVRGAAEPWRLPPGELGAALAGAGPAVVAGGGAARYAAALDASLPPSVRRLDVVGPTALALGRLALIRLRKGAFADLDAAVPIYGRPPDITRPSR